MAGKKGAAIQLQQEVNTDEEWAEMIKKPGLTVVDVYSAWCGPCVGMVGNLKKVKLEIGGDLLHLAIAKADTITCLSRFRNKSEPTWMFLSNGKMVNLMFGANAPRLIKLMTEEIQKEGEFQRSQGERFGIDIEELTPEERERAEREKAREAEANAAKEAVLNEEREKRRQKVVRKLVREMKYDSVVLFLPFLKDAETSSWPAYDKLMGILGSEFSTKRESLIQLTLEDAEKLFGVYDEDLAEELDRILKLGPCLAKIIGLPNKEPVEEGEPDEELLDAEEPIVEEPMEDGEEGEEKPEIHATEAIYYAIYGGGGPPDAAAMKEEEESRKAAGGEEEDEEEEDEEEGEMSLLTQLFNQYAEVTSLPALWAPLTEEQKAEAVILLFPSYIEELIGPEPPPPPPHLAVVFEAHKYPEIIEALEDYSDDVIRFGFFDGSNPDTAKKMATSYNEYLLSKKTGNEKFVMMLNNSKSDSVLILAQLAPIYVSLNQDDGKEDCGKFFPEDEEEQQETEIAVEEPEKAKAVGAPAGAPEMPPPQQAVDVLLVETVAATGEGQAAAAVDEAVDKAAPEGEGGEGGEHAEKAVQEVVQDAAQEPGEAAAAQVAAAAAGGQEGAQPAAAEAVEAAAAAAAGEAPPPPPPPPADAPPADAPPADAPPADAPPAEAPPAEAEAAPEAEPEAAPETAPEEPPPAPAEEEAPPPEAEGG